jgi:hypothetical protein
MFRRGHRIHIKIFSRGIQGNIESIEIDYDERFIFNSLQ